MLSLIGLLTADVLFVVALWRLGAAPRWRVDWPHLWQWLDSAPSDDVVIGLLRWVGIALGTWVLVSTCLYTAAALTRIPSLIRGTRWVTPFRGVIDRALAAGMAASIMVGAASTAAHAQSQPVAAVAGPPLGGSGSRPVAAVVLGHNRMPTGLETRQVRPGETLWDIATARVSEATGRPANDLRSADIAPYWRAVMRENQTRTVVPGEELVLPAVYGSSEPAAQSTGVAATNGKTPALATNAETYVVQPGDTLWDIADDHLADPFRWPQIFALNEGRVSAGHRVEDPDLIYPDQRLDMPSDAVDVDASPDPPPAVAESPDTPTPTVPAPDVAATDTTNTTTDTRPAPETPVPRSAEQDTKSSSGPPPTTGNGEAPRHRSNGEAEIGRDEAWVPAAIGLGLPLFAAGGIALKLTRDRRRQVSRCRPGREIPRPDPALEPLERTLRAIAADEAHEWVDATLRALTAALRDDPADQTPQVLCVRAGEMGMEVLLAEPLLATPAAFEAVDGGHVWRLDPAIDLAELRRMGAEQVPAAPAVVSLGGSPEGPVLVDLERVGTLSVEGDPARVRAFLAGAALELASAQWAEGIDVRLLDLTSSLGAVDNVTIVDDPSGLADELDSIAASVNEALGDRQSTLAARIDVASQEDWLPTVVVAATDTASDALDALARVGQARAGVAVVAAGPVEDATWRLVVIEDGSAVLEPLGMAVHAAGVPDGIAISQEALDEEKIAGAASLLAVAADESDLAPVVELDRDDVADDGPEMNRRDFDVWVSVLGPVEVTGWAEPIGKRKKLSEIVAYLATHSERPVPGERLRCACWSEDISYGSFTQAVSRVRRHLGTDASGGRHLPEGRGGGYQLGSSVGCDWTQFRALVASAQHSDQQEAIELYRQALSLVRGEPFADVTSGTYVWAWSELLVHEIQTKVVKAADALGSLALEAGDPDTALWAAHQGLLVNKTQLSLFDVEMQAADQLDDVDGITRSYRAAGRAAHELDPLAEVPDRTAELYRDLMSKRRKVVDNERVPAVR